MSHHEKKNSTDKHEVEHHSETNSATTGNAAKLANPLIGLTHEQLLADGAQFAKEHGLGHLTELFQKGAVVAQDPMGTLATFSVGLCRSNTLIAQGSSR